MLFSPSGSDMTPHGVLRPHSQNHSHHAWLVLECPRFGSTHRPGFFNHDSDGVLMIKAVSFDFYNTLVRFWPPLEEIQRGFEMAFDCPAESKAVKVVFRM